MERYVSERKITILGQHIRLIRPQLIRMPDVRKCDLPRASYNTRTKVNKERSGKVAAVTVRLKSGVVKAISKGVHIDVLSRFDIDPVEVAAVGWLLESGEFVWR